MVMYLCRKGNPTYEVEDYEVQGNDLIAKEKDSLYWKRYPKQGGYTVIEK